MNTFRPLPVILKRLDGLSNKINFSNGLKRTLCYDNIELDDTSDIFPNNEQRREFCEVNPVNMQHMAPSFVRTLGFLGIKYREGEIVECNLSPSSLMSWGLVMHLSDKGSPRVHKRYFGTRVEEVNPGEVCELVLSRSLRGGLVLNLDPYSVFFDTGIDVCQQPTTSAEVIQLDEFRKSN